MKKPEIKLAEAKLDAIKAIEERFSFENTVRKDIEKTAMEIAHPEWKKLCAQMPTPEIQRLEKIAPIRAEIKKPETNVKPVGLNIAMPENGGRRKERK